MALRLVGSGNRVQLDANAFNRFHLEGLIRGCRPCLHGRPLFTSLSPLPFSFEMGTPFYIKLGDGVMGFIEPSSGDCKSAQLVGWDTCSIETWRAISPNTIPAGWDINMDAVYCLPQLSGENFNYMRLPHVFFGGRYQICFPNYSPPRKKWVGPH